MIPQSAQSTTHWTGTTEMYLGIKKKTKLTYQNLWWQNVDKLSVLSDVDSEKRKTQHFGKYTLCRLSEEIAQRKLSKLLSSFYDRKNTGSKSADHLITSMSAMGKHPLQVIPWQPLLAAASKVVSQTWVWLCIYGSKQLYGFWLSPPTKILTK